MVKVPSTAVAFRLPFIFRSVFDECIDDIPSADDPLDKFLCCDVCLRKDDPRELAQIYCVICQKRFCTSHEKVNVLRLREDTFGYIQGKGFEIFSFKIYWL
jgi:hypothetical protein